MNKVKVGCLEYKVEYTSKKIYHDDGQKLGDCHFDNNLIRVWTKQGKFNQYLTLFHEITHAILSERDLDKINTEEVVEPLSKGIMAFIIDNKELIMEVLNG